MSSKLSVFSCGDQGARIVALAIRADVGHCESLVVLNEEILFSKQNFSNGITLILVVSCGLSVQWSIH